jgi:hypothetical protein
LQNIESQYNALQTDYNTPTPSMSGCDSGQHLSDPEQHQYCTHCTDGGNDTSLSIALGYVEKDIETLDIGEFPEKIDLTSRVNTVKGYLTRQPQNALQKWNPFSMILLLLANNLEITD